MKAHAAALAAAAFVLSGCTVAPPAGPTELELDAHYARMLDQVWANTELEGIVDRPEVGVVATLAPDNWIKTVYTCLGERGVADFGFVYGADTGLALHAADGRSRMSEQAQLAFYRCAAQYRLDGADIFGGERLRSTAQLDYIYDHYAEWTVPCMLRNGYLVPYAPSREDFVASQGRWNPYFAVRDVDPSELERICGSQLPAL